jgi:putative FmdB family regulatory protein
MPIYEYHCNGCGHDFEYLVMGGSEPDQCPACKADTVCRLMSTCGFVSKGSGGETVSHVGRSLVMRRLQRFQLCRMWPLMAGSTVTIGTRGSKLALWQANWVKDAVRATIRTSPSNWCHQNQGRQNPGCPAGQSGRQRLVRQRD